MKTSIRSFAIIALTITGFVFSPKAQAVVPPPDGGYPAFNTAEGTNALKNLSTGVGNAAVGWFSLFSNTDGSFNTALGAGTLLFNIGNQGAGEGLKNTAVGTAALLFNAAGTENTAVGAATLLNNTTGSENTALGSDALLHNTGGTFNMASGSQALFGNTTGTENTANGTFALNANTDGSFNTAVGAFALSNNTGSENTAVGVNALFSTTAGGNTAVGVNSLRLNTTGFQNVAVGHNALSTNVEGSFNTALGQSTLSLNIGDGNTAIGNVALFNNTGSNNTALGNVAGTNLTTGSNNIDIGYNVNGVAGESNTIRIGNSDITNTFISGISGTNSSGGVAVFCNSDGKLGVISSSARFKEDIKPIGKASEAILALKPVSFRYKKEIDAQGIPQFGLVAEEVEKINPDLIVRDREGKPQTVRYEQINAMLLNEFLKEHRKVKEQEARIAQLTKDVETLVAHARQQDSQMQRMSAEIEVSKVEPKVVSGRP
jgi:hypothetical protein